MKLAERLARERAAFERERSEFLNHLDSLPPQILSRPPAPGRWSPLQVAEHLMLGERVVLFGLPDFHTLQHQHRTIKDRVLWWVVLGVLKGGIRVQVPETAMQPHGNLTLEEIRNRWDESQAWLNHWILSASATDIRSAVFRHPVCGPITTAQVLRLARLHFRSHRRKMQVA